VSDTADSFLAKLGGVTFGNYIVKSTSAFPTEKGTRLCMKFVFLGRRIVPPIIKGTESTIVRIVVIDKDAGLYDYRIAT
jgi:hypothetical protein